MSYIYKYKWLLFSVITLLIIVAYIAKSCNQLDFEKFYYVKTGMTRNQIYEVLGCEPGDYTMGEYSGMADAYGGEGWVIKERELVVVFDDNDIAKEVLFLCACKFSKPPILVRIKKFILFD